MNKKYQDQITALIQLCNKANLAKDVWTLEEATTVGVILSEFRGYELKEKA